MDEIRRLIERGKAYHRHGMAERALDSLTRAQASAKAAGDNESWLKAMLETGDFERERGHYGEVVRICCEVLPYIEASSDENRERRGRVLSTLGMARIQEGDPKGAIPALQEAYSLLTGLLGQSKKIRISRDDLGKVVTNCFANLAVAHLDLKQYAEAERIFVIIIKASLKCNAQEMAGRTYVNLARVYYYQNRLDECTAALDKADHALRQVPPIKAMVHIGNVALLRGNALERRDDINGAEVQYRTAEDLFRQLGDKASIASAVGNLGLLAWRKGDASEARRMLTWARDNSRPSETSLFNDWLSEIP